MGLKPRFSRRDFLKLAGVGAATTAILTGCGDLKLEPPGELPRKIFDEKTVVYNGKTVSVSELNLEASGYYSKLVGIIQSKISGDSSAAIRPQGYQGNDFPPGWELDPSKISIFINETKNGDMTSHAFIGRKTDGSMAGVGNGEISKIVNSIISTTAYKDHSLLVIGRNNNALWFDNVESKTDKGTARIVVDGSRGRVHQITTNKPNFIEEMIQGQEVEMNIGEIDINSGETEFTDILTPMSEGFMTILDNYYKMLPPDMKPEDKINNIKHFFSGTGLNSSDTNDLVGLFGEAGNQYSEVLKRYNTNIPFNNSELAFVNAVLAENLKKRFSQGFIKNFETKIKGTIPTVEDLNTKAINEIVSERISIPLGTPELYFVQVKEPNSDYSSWRAVSKRTVWENDMDGTTFTPNKDDFMIGEYWYTHGEVSDEIVNNERLRQSEKSVDAFPFDTLKTFDSNRDMPLFGLNLKEVRQVDSEAIKFCFDPSTNKITPALFVEVDGKDRVLEFMLENFGGKKDIKDLPLISNRKIPLFGNSPRVLSDVTEEVQSAITRAQENISPLMLGNHDDFWLSANMHSGPEGLIDYDELRNTFSPEAMFSVIPPGTLIQGGPDNSILINSSNSVDQGNTKIYVFSTNGEDPDPIREIIISHPIVVSPLEVGEFSGGSGYYAVIAEDKVKGEKYVVTGDDFFQIRARSTAKLATIVAGEIAVAIAVIYGGYRLIGKVPIGKNFTTGLVELLAKDTTI